MTQEKEPGNLYFQVIEFGINKLEQGVTFQEFEQHIANLGIEMSNYRARAIDDNQHFALKPNTVVGSNAAQSPTSF